MFIEVGVGSGVPRDARTERTRLIDERKSANDKSTERRKGQQRNGGTKAAYRARPAG